MAAKGQADAGGPPEIEASMKGLLAMPGVKGYLVFNELGIPIKWSSTGFGPTPLPTSTASVPPEVVHYAALVTAFTQKSRSTCKRIFADDDPDASELVYYRIHTTQHEIIVAPAEGCTLVVLQGNDAVGGDVPAAAAAIAAGGAAVSVPAAAAAAVAEAKA